MTKPSKTRIKYMNLFLTAPTAELQRTAMEAATELEKVLPCQTTHDIFMAARRFKENASTYQSLYGAALGFIKTRDGETPDTITMEYSNDVKKGPASKPFDKIIAVCIAMSQKNDEQ